MSQSGNIWGETHTGGFAWAAPTVTLTSQNMGINGGLSFDLPLAALTNAQNRATEFVSANAQAVGPWVRRNVDTIVGSGSGVDLSISASGAVPSSVAEGAIASMYDLNRQAITTAENIYGRNLQVQKYSVERQTKSSLWGRVCFITTAICEAEGKADDCEELQMLRNWRDTYLAKLPGGPSLIRVYYALAPKAVESIKKSKYAPTVFETMRTVYLAHALAGIRAGDNDRVMDAYCALLDFALTAAADCEKDAAYLTPAMQGAGVETPAFDTCEAEANG